MSLLLSGDRVFEWSRAWCLLVLLVGGCQTAPETIEPPEYEDDFGTSFDAEPITEESVAEEMLMHRRAQFDLMVDGVIPLESKVDPDIGVGGKFNYEVAKNLFMGVSVGYTNLEIDEGATLADPGAVEGIQHFDNYDQWDFIMGFDYDIPLTRPSADLGALTFRVGVGAGVTLIEGDEDEVLKEGPDQIELQELVSPVIRPTVQLRLRVWEHGLAFLGVGYNWVTEERVDEKRNNQRVEIDDDINFDSFHIGGGFAFEW